MSKALVIVESPAKARTISRYLGKDFTVKASVGHIKDLPKTRLGVDVRHDFAPSFEILPGKEKVVTELRTAASRAGRIYLAADPDREGEAICQHIYEEIAEANKDVYRVMFYEITKDAIKRAFDSPQQVNQNLVQAQLTRRILDRLVGYKISPLLWRKVRRGLSAGRVQTVTLRLIVDREREIRAFDPEEYWVFTAHLEGKEPPVFKARAIKLDGKKFKIDNETDAMALRQELQAGTFEVESVKKTTRRQQPRPPYTTSKLQQEAYRRFKFPARKTMQVAQRLYEGIDVPGEGRVGLITYMRTDSTRISSSALDTVRAMIAEKYGDKFLPKKARQFQKSAGAQDAHEAIRPTDVGRTPEALRPHLSAEEFKLYTLIWQRFVASQMEPALFDHTDIRIAAGRCLFQTTGDVLRFPGFLQVYQETAEEDAVESEGSADRLPALQEKQKLDLKHLETLQQFTQPPPRYTEATLIKTLEEKGIGRPSTYAQIVSVIQNREYVVKTEGRFQPTETGEVVVDLLTESFPDLFDYAYTARMEKDLDLIEQGEQNWQSELHEFYEGFRDRLERAEKEMRSLKEPVPSGEICEQCGARMMIRWGKFGRFLACERYPECRNTRELSTAENGDERGETPEIDETCEKCGAKMVLKRGRYGTFLACSNYPECRNTRKLTAEGEPAREDKVLDEICPECGRNLVEKTGRYGKFVACSGYPECRFIKKEKLDMPCPEPDCDGEVVVRRSRKGKVFYGCSRYPACKFTSWAKPVPGPCPECGHPYLVERETKRSGRFIQCPNKSCRYRTEI